MKSAYRTLGYASLHIQRGTRQRLNLIKAKLQAREHRLVTQDELLNRMMDHYVAATEGQSNAVAQ